MEHPASLENKFIILEEISSVISATKDINTLAHLMLDRSIEYTNAEKGSLMFLDESNELYILASRGFNISFVENYRVKLGEGIAGIVAKKPAIRRIPDMEDTASRLLWILCAPYRSYSISSSSANSFNAVTIFGCRSIPLLRSLIVLVSISPGNVTLSTPAAVESA